MSLLRDMISDFPFTCFTLFCSVTLSLFPWLDNLSPGLFVLSFKKKELKSFKQTLMWQALFSLQKEFKYNNKINGHREEK